MDLIESSVSQMFTGREVLEAAILTGTSAHVVHLLTAASLNGMTFSQPSHSIATHGAFYLRDKCGSISSCIYVCLYTAKPVWQCISFNQIRADPRMHLSNRSWDRDKPICT